MEGESLASLIARMAETEEFRQPMRMVRQIRPPTTSLTTLTMVDPRSEFGEMMAAYLGVEPEVFGRMTAGTEDPLVRTILGCRMYHELVSVDHRRYCPLCLREGSYHRAIWDLAMLSVCPEHSVRLLERCPDCNHRVSWHYGKVGKCQVRECHAELAAAEPVPVPRDELSGARGVAALLQGEAPEGLAPLAPGDLILACFKLGPLARGLERSPRPRALVERHPEEAHLVLDEGWKAISDWPHGFQQFMDARRAHTRRRGGRYGIVQAYGHLPKLLTDHADTPMGQVLSAAFVRHVAVQSDLATRAHEVRRYRSTEDLQHRHMTATQAARALGVNYDRMIVLAESHDLFLVPPEGKGAPALMRADRVKRLADQMASLVTKTGAYEMLDISKETFWTVEQQALLEPVRDEAGELRYRQADIQALLDRLEAAVEPKPAKLRLRELRPLPDLARLGCPTGELLRRVVAGEVRVTALDKRARGLRRLLMDPSIMDREDDGALSVVQVAERVGVKQEVAYHWVKTGLLGTRQVLIDGKIARRVPLATLAEFQATYVTGVELAASMGSRSRRWSSPHLLALGLKPVSGPSVDGARQFLFRRDTVMNTDLRPLRRFVRGQAPGGREDGREILRLIRGIGRAAARILKIELSQRSNRYVDNGEGTVVQVVTGRRRGLAGAWCFVISASQIRRLDAAGQGYLALGFVGREQFLLVPWTEAKGAIRMRQGGGGDVYVDMDGEGRPSALAAYAQRVADGPT